MLTSLLVGLIAGALAKAIMQGDRGLPSSWWMTLILGLVGGALGGWVFGFLGLAAWGILGRIIVSTVGSILVIVLLRQLSK